MELGRGLAFHWYEGSEGGEELEDDEDPFVGGGMKVQLVGGDEYKSRKDPAPELITIS